jgi:hypothetical protein
MDAACKAHDQCYAAAGISASYNLSASNGGSGGTLAQATAAQACNQALYNAARLNAGSPGAKAVREWLKNGDKTPFGYILHPGTEAASWKEQ